MNKVEFANGEIEIVNTPQSVYDAFNNFIFSNDLKVFSKLIARHQLFKETLDVPGDIVECGVFKGSGILTWLKLKKTLCPYSLKKIVGFDMFDQVDLLKSLTGDDKIKMSSLFSNRKFEYNNYKNILESIIYDAGFNDGDFELIQGDSSETTYDYVMKRPGMKISLLYLDMDIEKPTYDSLNNLYERVSKGGYIIFDEYACHQWSESKGADKFANEHNLEIKVLPYLAPTAYIKK
jgi:hypothetical protein